MSHNNQKKIAVINDFCGFGRCSIAVSLPIISAMGIQCCPLPTAIFSNHTGYESFYRTEHKVGTCRAGTGDVFSSIIAADSVIGKDLNDAVLRASSFVAKALKRTVELDIPEADGICFEDFLKGI